MWYYLRPINLLLEVELIIKSLGKCHREMSVDVRYFLGLISESFKSLNFCIGTFVYPYKNMHLVCFSL